MDFLAGSFKVGRLFGIDVRIHILFILWAVFRLMRDPSADTIVFLTMLYGIVLVHELGHCFGARSVGGDARQILMWPLGGLAYAYAPMRPWPQFVTVAAGPLVNVVFCIVGAFLLSAASGFALLPGINPLGPGFIETGWFIGWRLPMSDTVIWWVFQFYYVNLFLLAFNLLPIYPLDGGQLFHAIIWPYTGLYRATRIACQVGIGGAIVLLVLGVQTGGTILFFIALFGGFTCWQRLQMANAGMLVEDDRFDYSYMNRGYREPWYRRLGNWWRARFTRRPRRDDSAGGWRGPGAGGGRRHRRTPTPNPNPGGWDARQKEQRELEEEVDRILKKVRDHGIASLSYVEQQKLKRATELRQQEDSDFNRHTGV